MVSWALIVSALTVIFGILVIKFPKVISWIIGIYLILTGLISLVLAL